MFPCRQIDACMLHPCSFWVVQIQIQIIFIVPYKYSILYWLKYNKFVHDGGTDKEKKGG
jgi:hypothetical protein